MIQLSRTPGTMLPRNCPESIRPNVAAAVKKMHTNGLFFAYGYTAPDINMGNYIWGTYEVGVDFLDTEQGHVDYILTIRQKNNTVQVFRIPTGNFSLSDFHQIDAAISSGDDALVSGKDLTIHVRPSTMTFFSDTVHAIYPAEWFIGTFTQIIQRIQHTPDCIGDNDWVMLSVISHADTSGVNMLRRSGDVSAVEFDDDALLEDTDVDDRY